MSTKTYKDGAEQIIVSTPLTADSGDFVEVTRRVKDRAGRWRTEESVAIGVEAWRQICAAGVKP